MLRLFATQLCLAFGLGLTASWALGMPATSWLNVALLMGCFLVVGSIAAGILPQRWLDGPDTRGWIALGLVAAIAVAYLQLRLPRPTATDVSQLIAGNSSSEQARIWGTVQTSPSLTASNKVRFWLQANRTHDGRSVDGKLYVTAPLLQGTGIYPGQTVAIAGQLYQPRTPKNPGAFNFRDYLSRQGAFAGFNAETIELVDEGPPWGWWQLRRRIVKAFVRGLGSPAGQLVGSIALGRRAVDLPPDVRELFVRGGLAHVLAASGFHVSLLLGSVGTLVQGCQPRTRLSASLGALRLYVGLTGISPSVARAAIMGAAGAIAQQRDRQTNAIGALLLAATALLTIQPLWIADLGFQLSFLATLGLLATAPTVAGWFARVPKPIAGAIAVPIAVLPWVLPLQLWTFGVFPPYSIAVNILTVPLVIIVSLGGMLAALVALVFPAVGSAVAGLLFYPAHALMGIVTWCDRLPGSSFAIGRITWWQLGVLYVAIFAVWGLRWLQRRWGFIALAGLIVVLAPLAHQRLTSSQVTLLAAGREPILVARDRHATLLVNCGDATTARYTVVPFLQQTGIARLEAALSVSQSRQTGWPTVARSLPIAEAYSHPDYKALESSSIGQWLPISQADPLAIGNMQVDLAGSQPTLLELSLHDRQWLILERFSRQAKLPLPTATPDRPILIWSGQRLPSSWLEAISPTTAIATSSYIDTNTMAYLEARGTQIYATARDGAIDWQQTGRGPWQLRVGAGHREID